MRRSKGGAPGCSNCAHAWRITRSRTSPPITVRAYRRSCAIVNRSFLIAGLIAACLALGPRTADAQLGESAEIKFSSADATALRAKVDELGSVVRIYEYL